MNVTVDRAAIAAFCRRNGIARLSLFGSVLRADFGAESDVDVLVRFQPTARVSLFDMARLADELSPLLGGRVIDLRTEEDLSRYFRSSVVQGAEAVYAA